MKTTHSTPVDAQRLMQRQVEHLTKRITSMAVTGSIDDLILLFGALAALVEDSQEPVELVYLSGLGLKS